MWHFFVEWVADVILSRKRSFHLTCEVFLAKNQKNLNLCKIRKYDEETEYFEKKTFSSFKKASLPKMEGAKYAGGSRPSCFSLLAGLI